MSRVEGLKVKVDCGLTVESSGELGPSAFLALPTEKFLLDGEAY